MDTVIKWIVPINQSLKFPIEAKKGSMIVEYIQFDYLSPAQVPVPLRL